MCDTPRGRMHGATCRVEGVQSHEMDSTRVGRTDVPHWMVSKRRIGRHVRRSPYNLCVSTVRQPARVLPGVHLDARDAELVRERARDADRSVSAELRVALRRYLAPRGAEVGKTTVPELTVSKPIARCTRCRKGTIVDQNGRPLRCASCNGTGRVPT
jgi:hypothetical protein